MYDFWDYFWGYLLLSAFVLPLVAVIVIKVAFLAMAIMGGMFGFSKTSDEGVVNVRVRYYDEDEDR